MATHDAIPHHNDGYQMIHCAVQCVAGKTWRGLGWRLCAVGLICLAVVTCIGPSSDLQKSEPGQISQASSRPATTSQIIPAGGLNFIPDVGSVVELRGMATIGSWKTRSTEIHGQVILDTDAVALSALFDRIQSTAARDQSPGQTDLPMLSLRIPPIGIISVPVMSLHGGSAGMDRDLQNALNVRQHPSIEYVFEQLQQASLQSDPQNHQAELKLKILGKLNMAGVGRPIAMDVTVQRDSRGHFRLHAQAALLMTDFGVTPPGALFGLIKANDNVLAVFDLDLVLKE